MPDRPRDRPDRPSRPPQGNRSIPGGGKRSGWHGGGQGGRQPAQAPRRPPEPAGYAVRALAVRLVSAVLDRRRALDDAMAAEFATAAGSALESRDRGLARLIATTALRRKGELDLVIARFIERPLPEDRGLLDPILLCAAAQLLVLEIAPHAVINIAVEQCRHDRGARRFDKLANAVLRRVAEHGRGIVESGPGMRANIPGWLWSRWVAAYSETTAEAIAENSLREAALDVTPRDRGEAGAVADALGGMLLATGSIRVLDPAGRIDELPGFNEGRWWVQDAAAALPARLVPKPAGARIADLCAAPGGKTAQLASFGALVTAVDVSRERLGRVSDNLARLKLSADIVAADATVWKPDAPFDAVLLDAPCTATGTIRRHPDILHLKRAGDLAPLVDLQARLLDHALTLLRPGGTLVYCTCSLEPEEGEGQIARVLARRSDVTRAPISAGDVGIDATWITAAGDLRTLPLHSPGRDTTGMDGFYAARLVVG